MMPNLRAVRRDCTRTLLFLDTLERASLEYSIKPELVWSECRDARASDARARVWGELRAAGWSWNLIARVFYRDETTVRESVMRHKGIYREKKKG